MDYTQLIQKAKDNDELAIYELMSAVKTKATHIALKYVNRDPMKADDIVQESFVRAFSNINQLEDPERFEAWFFKIVTNISINKIHTKLIEQHSKNFSELSYRDNTFIYANVKDDRITFNPKESFDYEELKQEIKEFLDSLPVEQSQAVYMYYFEDLNAREIAEVMKTSEETVRSRLRYAREKIKEKVTAMEKQDTSTSASPKLSSASTLRKRKRGYRLKEYFMTSLENYNDRNKKVKKIIILNSFFLEPCL